MFLLCVVVFCVAGMNTVVIGLGAGGSHPSNIPIIDRISVVNGVFLIIAGIFGGSVNNKLGPKYTVNPWSIWISYLRWLYVVWIFLTTASEL
jgi:hypothetical protein